MGVVNTLMFIQCVVNERETIETNFYKAKN